MTTIRKVAERAQVSSATVSRVLNNDERVSKDARDRVLRAAAELDYRPNRIARSLRRKQTETIGVIVSDIENPHFTRAVRSIEDAAYRQGYRVILCNTDETPEKQRAYLEVLAAEQVSGVIIAPADPADPTISQLIDLGIPIVAFDRRVTDQRADAVYADNVVAGRLATEHLLKAGCRSVGFIAGRQEIQTGADRLAGYEFAMRASGLEPAIGYGEFRLETAQIVTRQLLRDQPSLDGLVVANNLMAIGALLSLREVGRRVPEDVGFISIDDPPWANLTDPPMTTLGQPIQQMAQSAFDLVVDRITKRRDQTRFVIYNFELHMRRSSRATDGIEATAMATAK